MFSFLTLATSRYPIRNQIVDAVNQYGWFVHNTGEHTGALAASRTRYNVTEYLIVAFALNGSIMYATCSGHGNVGLHDRGKLQTVLEWVE